jgi:hypothetical protein
MSLLFSSSESQVKGNFLASSFWLAAMYSSHVPIKVVLPKPAGVQTRMIGCSISTKIRGKDIYLDSVIYQKG